MTPAQLTRHANTLQRKLTKTFPQWRFTDASFIVANGLATMRFVCEGKPITHSMPDTPTVIRDLTAWATAYEEK